MREADEFDEDGYEGRPSKSQLKRDSEAMQDLGIELTELSRAQLREFALPEELLQAVLAAQTITSHSALKRQRKFIGKLLRDIDPEPIQQQLARLKNTSAEAIHELHLIERWRDRLLTGGDQDINAFLESYPGADRQKLRQLVRDAHRERQAAAPPRSARLLFKALRESIAA
jgi:ribosome-associated protein